MSSDPTTRPLVFPIKGLHESAGFDVQPPGTTNDALNVRAFCSLAGRARGGSRSGTKKYTYGRVTSAEKPIQNMVKAVKGAVFPSSFNDLAEDFQGYAAEVSPDLSPLWGMASIFTPVTEGIRVHPALWETTADGLVWRKSSNTTSAPFLAHFISLMNDADSDVNVTVRANTTMSTANGGFGIAAEASKVGPFIKTSVDFKSGYAAYLEPTAANVAELRIIKLIPGEADGYEVVAMKSVGVLLGSSTVTNTCNIRLWVSDETQGSMRVNAQVTWNGGGTAGANIDETITYIDTNPGLLFNQGGAGVGIFNADTDITNPTFAEGTIFRTINIANVRYRNPGNRVVAMRWLPNESGVNRYFRPVGLSTITYDGVSTYAVQPTDRFDADAVDTNEVFVDTTLPEYASFYDSSIERSVALERPWDAGGPFDLEVVLKIPSSMAVNHIGKTQFLFRVDPALGYVVEVEMQFVIDHTDSNGNGTGRISSITLRTVGEDGETIFGGDVAVPVPFVNGSVFRVEDNGTELGINLDGKIIGVFPFPLVTGTVELPEISVPDGALNDNLGRSVATADNIMVAGAPNDDDNGTNSGSVYVFNATTGAQLFKITASDGAANDSFGWSVDIANGVILVGAPGHDDTAVGSGAAYMFSAVSGLQLTKLVASDAAINDSFGTSVALDSTIAVVGTGGISTANPGAAYVFSVSTKAQLLKLTASDGVNADLFGESVAVQNNVIGIGASGNDDAGSNSGSAYLFDATTGSELFKLVANDAAASDRFGRSVSIDNGVFAVGAPDRDDGAANTGAVYLFDVATGVQNTKLIAAERLASEGMGFSVALGNNFVVAGAPSLTGGGTGGVAYLFNATTGAQLAQLQASNTVNADFLGFSVAIADSLAFFGAPGRTPVFSAQGSVYPFDLDVPSLGTPPDTEDTYAAISQGHGVGVGLYPEYVGYVSEMRWVRSGGSQYDETGTGAEGKLLAVSGGDIVEVTTGVITPIPTGLGALSDNPLNIQSVSAFNSVFFTDGTSIREYRLATELVASPTPTAGVFPTDPKLVTLYRGRLVWSGTPDDPYNWFMSAAGNPLDYDYSPPTPNETQAVAGNNSVAGRIGDVITALVPFGDDYMIFGCDSTIWQMTGDPAAGGVIDLISDQTGMAFGSAWAKDPASTLYFWGNDGVYRMSPGSRPQNMTKNRIDFRLRNVALDENRIFMAWNYIDAELWVLIQPADSADPVRVIVWESRTDAWWEDSYPVTQGPNSILAYNSNLANDQALLLGGRDGFIYKVDQTAGTDDGAAIESRVRFAPFISPDRSGTVLMNSISPVLANGSATVRLNIYTGQSAEGCMSATAPRAAMDLAHAGRNSLMRRPIRGYAVQCELALAAGTVPWALESLIAGFDMSGLPVRHARTSSEGATGGS